MSKENASAASQVVYTRQPVWAVGYARVSTDHQGASGVGLAGQRESIRAFIDTKGWQLIEIFEDVHTGVGVDSFRKRDGLRRALDMAVEQGAFVVADNWSRLTRHAETGAALERIIGDPRRLISVDAGESFVEASKAGRLARAEAEAREISRRTMAGIARRKVEGAIFGNPGIRSVQVLGARAAADKAEALANQIADLMRTAGVHNGDLTRENVVNLLNVAGVFTSHGKEWTLSRVRQPLARARAILDSEEDDRMRAEPLYGTF